MAVQDTSLAFEIHGMDCAEEVAVLKLEVGPVVGGEDRLAFDVLSGKMTVAAGVPVTAYAVRDAVPTARLMARRMATDSSSPQSWMISITR